MFRTVLTASAIALIAGAAIAQDDAQTPPAETPDVAAQPEATAEEAPAMMMVEPIGLDFQAVTTKDDARAFGEKEFKLADADQDGKVNKAEFVAYAATFFPAPAAAADEAAGEGEAEMAADAEMTGEGDIDVPAEAEATAPEELFAALSGGKETISEKQLVKARLDNFKQADANKDNQLDDAEKEAFTALVTGRKAS